MQTVFKTPTIGKLRHRIHIRLRVDLPAADMGIDQTFPYDKPGGRGSNPSAARSTPARRRPTARPRIAFFCASCPASSPDRKKWCMAIRYTGSGVSPI